MKSALPKVLHEAAGEPLLAHVVRAARAVGGEIGVVAGRGADEVRAALPPDVRVFIQKKRLGSGHAVMAAAAWLRRRKGPVAVLCGDAPLVRGETARRLCATHLREGNAVTILTARVPDPTGYGRIVRGADGRPRAIVEEREASAEERAVDEINSGAYCFSAPDLLRALAALRPDNSKGEYYLTDAVASLARAGKRAGALCVPEAEEVLGVNNRKELAAADRLLRRRILDRLMDRGVTVTDPDTTYVGPEVRAGQDAVIAPFTFLLGRTVLGEGARVGPFSHLENCRVGAGAEVKASFAEDAVIEAGAKVGPYARLRPGTRIGAGARVGNFVEVKNSRLGPGAKANHLAYVGDASVGGAANIGAGAITCNYDGFQKHRTVIGAGAFIGSNANLVAPLRVGRGAVVGAGSTVARDVPADALALERAPHVLKRGWAAARRRLRGKSRSAHKK